MSKQPAIFLAIAWLAGTSTLTADEPPARPATGAVRPASVFAAGEHGASTAAADNTAAIQAAIDACQKAGGGIVRASRGSFPHHRNAADDLEPRLASRPGPSRRDAVLRQRRSRLHRRG